MKVISLATDLTEILGELDLLSSLAGISSTCTLPVPSETISVVSNGDHLFLDQILSLKPELILISGNRNNPWTQLCLEAGLPVLHLQPKSILSVPEHLIHIGRLMGVEALAVEKAKSWINEFKALQYQGARDVNRVTGYIEFGSESYQQPPVWAHQLLDAAGITPLFPSENEEDFFSRIHFDAAIFVSENPSTSASELKTIADRRNKETGGYKWHEESCYALPENQITVCGPHLLDGLRALIRIRAGIEARGPVINQLD
ncbi:MAG: ABC transporter substrate-binding protein [Bacteroidetes bacterium]|nr:ABC transporter substrate-binding protein [Bacteroidota bacterium]